MSGDEQAGTVGRVLSAPVVVKVQDAAGQPVPSQAVRFAVTSGSGSVAVGLATTDATGLAQERWTLGTNTTIAQSVTATVVSSAAGAPTYSVAFTATPQPDAPTRMTVVGDTVRGMAVSDTSRISLQATDQYQNAISANALTATFTSDQGAVATVASVQPGSALIRAVQGGTATISISLGAVVARVHIVAEATHQIAYPLGANVGVTRRAGSRVVTLAQAGVYEWNGQGFTFTPLNSGVSMYAMDGTDDGQVWVSGVNGWTSPSIGVWTRMPAAAQSGQSWVSAVDASHVYSSTVAPGDLAYAYQFDGAAWSDLHIPQTIADSSFQAISITAVDASTLLGFGSLEKIRYAGRYQSSILRWSGGVWTELTMPAVPNNWQNSGIDHVTTDHRSGATFGLQAGLTGSAYATRLGAISGPQVSASDLPVFADGESTVQLGRTTGGEPVVLTNTGWWVRSGATWSHHIVLGGWSPLYGEGFVVDADGTLWFPASKGTDYAMIRASPAP
ncbi:MAG: hypothetical protein HOQ11_01895 [Gemmatimonadaceae bacterium]|nr:hypothetical protein [Gemmatimonadaceae bacterium]